MTAPSGYAKSRLPIHGRWFDIAVFDDGCGEPDETIVLLSPNLDDLVSAKTDEPPLVRIHSQCFTGDTFGSERCDCRAQLQYAVERLEEAGRGLLLYCREHEGRGIGLAAKLLAYNLQDVGYDTYEANSRLGYPEDARRYKHCARLLGALSIDEVSLLTNNPAKVAALEDAKIRVHRVPTPTFATPYNRRYLEAKAVRGYSLDSLAPPPGVN